MKLICTETYNDIRFTLREGDSTDKVPYLTEAELVKLLADYPQKFKEVKEKPAKEDTDRELEIEFKEPTLYNKKVNLTKK